MGACLYICWIYSRLVAPTDSGAAGHAELGQKFKTQSTWNTELFPEMHIYFYGKDVVLRGCYRATM